MKEKKKTADYPTLRPLRRPGLPWHQDEAGFAVLEVEHRGFFDRLAQKFWGRPRRTQVHLEKFGSFLWPLMDGSRTVEQLAKLQRERFAEEAEPVYERLVQYLQLLKSYGFIVFAEPPAKESGKEK